MSIHVVRNVEGEKNHRIRQEHQYKGQILGQSNLSENVLEYPKVLEEIMGTMRI